MQSERKFRAAVRLRYPGLPSVADAPAAAASLEFCGFCPRTACALCALSHNPQKSSLLKPCKCSSLLHNIMQVTRVLDDVPSGDGVRKLNTALL